MRHRTRVKAALLSRASDRRSIVDLQQFVAVFPQGDNLKLHSPFLIKSLAVGFSIAMWMLFRTLRLRAVASSPGTNPYDNFTGERYLYCVWHDSMVIPTFAGKHRCTSALISQHADGSFVAQVLRLRKISAIRGSTNRITPGAIRDLLNRAKDEHIVITPDGPRGPNRCASTGIAFIASRTGRAVVPTAYACSRYWRIKGSWSDLIIPKPFAKVFLLGGDPIYVASGFSTDQLQHYVARIQTEMDRLNEAAEARSKPKTRNQTSSDEIRGRIDEANHTTAEDPVAKNQNTFAERQRETEKKRKANEKPARRREKKEQANTPDDSDSREESAA